MLHNIFCSHNNFLFENVLYPTEDDGTIPVPMVNTLKKLKSGYINGTRVSLGKKLKILVGLCN